MDTFLIFVAPFLVIITGIVVAFWWGLNDEVVRREKGG
ncbi:cytochrome bd oxidase small subunit CydS [Ornithinibacillus sp. 179-J 7C1 HS]